MKTRYQAVFVFLLWATSATAQLADTGDSRSNELHALSSRLNYRGGQIDVGKGLASIHLNDSFRYLDPAGAQTLLTGIWGNPPQAEGLLGVIVPADFDPFSPGSWAVVVEYSEDGYVDDSDAEKINYDDMLAQMKVSAREANEERTKEGYSSIELIGWAAAPRYDKQNHKFYWAKEISFGDNNAEHTLNYSLRILGRRGVLVLNAVSGISQLDEIERATPELLKMVEFNNGHRYADYTPGVDKAASYGLAALVAGGVAAKTGLLKGLLVALVAAKKFLIIGAVALVGYLRRFFSRKGPTA